MHWPVSWDRRLGDLYPGGDNGMAQTLGQIGWCGLAPTLEETGLAHTLGKMGVAYILGEMGSVPCERWALPITWERCMVACTMTEMMGVAHTLGEMGGSLYHETWGCPYPVRDGEWPVPWERWDGLYPGRDVGWPVP